MGNASSSSTTTGDSSAPGSDTIVGAPAISLGSATSGNVTVYRNNDDISSSSPTEINATGGTASGLFARGGDVIIKIRNRYQSLTNTQIGMIIGGAAASVVGGILIHRKLKRMDEQRKTRDEARMAQIQRDNDRKQREANQSANESLKLFGSLIGRDGLLADILRWIRTESITKHERMWLTIGSAGTGKSAISVGLSRELREPSIESKLLVTKIRLLYHQICYASLSNETDEKQKHQLLSSLVRACSDARMPVKAPDPGTGAFDDLRALFIALNGIPVPADDTIYVILIDGLDESPSIASLLTHADTLRAIPSWLRLICTSRPVPGLPRRNPLVHRYDLDTSSSQRLALVAFVNNRFPPILDELKSASDKAMELIDSLISKSGISFMYAQYIMNDVHVGRLPPTVRALDQLPTELDDYYHQSFARHWPLNKDGILPSSYDIARMILETRDPCAFMIDSRLTCATDKKIEGAANQLTPFIARNITDGLYMARHKSFDDWLALPANPYHINRARGKLRRQITRIMMDERIPNDFNWTTSVPLFMSVLTKWLRCRPTIPPLDSIEAKDRPVGYYTELTHVPAKLHHQLFYALEYERHHGFWDMTDIRDHVDHGDFLVHHIAVMPERFNAAQRAVLHELSLLPLDGVDNRITHINGTEAKNESHLLQMIKRALSDSHSAFEPHRDAPGVYDQLSCVVTVIRAGRPSITFHAGVDVVEFDTYYADILRDDY